jgi:lipoprotein NlpD
VKIFFRTISIFCVALSLFSCTESESPPAYVPVVDATAIDRIPQNGLHQVRVGETIYSIAWRYGLDYRMLAVQNGLSPSTRLHVGQTIYLRGKPVSNKVVEPAIQKTILPKPVQQPIPTQWVNKNYSESAAEPRAVVHVWEWPARGRVIGNFSGVNKGINIAGELSDPVYAAASGKVVYSGHGLRSYGNLIIIKHNSRYLTAYAHNRKNLVNEGQWVKIGQVIAQMGNTGTRKTMLHFEIRREGVPINPLVYLPSH